MATPFSLLLSLGFNVRRSDEFPFGHYSAGFGMGMRRRSLNDA